MCSGTGPLLESLDNYSLFRTPALPPPPPTPIRVAAADAAGNVSNQSLAALATTLSAGDITPPTVAITAPIANATVSNTVTLTATASDNVAVSDVQFQLDGVNLGPDLTAPPYSITWNTTTASNGIHNLTAIARDTSHNTTLFPD